MLWDTGENLAGRACSLYLLAQQHINNSLVISPFMAPLGIPIPEREEQLFSLTLLVHMDSKDMP